MPAPWWAGNAGGGGAGGEHDGEAIGWCSARAGDDGGAIALGLLAVRVLTRPLAQRLAGNHVDCLMSCSLFICR